VIDLATWQCIRDRRNNEPLSRLLIRILDYAELKRLWGYGHIQIKRQKAFYGYYVNARNDKRKLYLGYGFTNVLCLLKKRHCQTICLVAWD